MKNAAMLEFVNFCSKMDSDSIDRVVRKKKNWTRQKNASKGERKWKRGIKYDFVMRVGPLPNGQCIGI
jgi:hypothetical protein